MKLKYAEHQTCWNASDDAKMPAKEIDHPQQLGAGIPGQLGHHLEWHSYLPVGADQKKLIAARFRSDLNMFEPLCYGTAT